MNVCRVYNKVDTVEMYSRQGNPGQANPVQADPEKDYSVQVDPEESHSVQADPEEVDLFHGDPFPIESAQIEPVQIQIEGMHKEFFAYYLHTFCCFICIIKRQ